MKEAGPLPAFFYAALVGLTVVVPAAAAEAEAEEEKDEIGVFDACREPTPRDEDALDKTRRRLYRTVCGAALWFDGLFGERSLVAARKTYGRLQVSNYYSEFEGNKLRVRFDVRARLPALKERLSVFIGRDDQDDYARDRTEGPALRSHTQALDDRDTFLAGLGFVAAETQRFQSDFKIGVRTPRLPKVFVQNRLTYVPVSDDRKRMQLRATPFWNNRDRFGLTVNSDVDRILAEDWIVRLSSVGTVGEETLGLDWRSALLFYQNLAGTSALAYETFIRGATAAPEPLTEYGARTIYRLPLMRERLFAEIIVGYSWPRSDPALEREGSAAVGVGVELPFGQTPPPGT